MNSQIKNKHICITISDIGAEMQSMVKDGKEYLWSADEKYWPEHSPILFPFVGRFTNGKYLLNGKEYAMDIHGFARKLPYSISEKTETKVVYELLDNAETYAMYPYHFSLKVGYELVENTVAITYQVQNYSDETMYFGIGGHPGFALPFDDGLDFSDYYLHFSGESHPTRIGHTESCYLSGIDETFLLKDNKFLPLTHEMFDLDAIVLKNMADTVTLKSDKGSRSVTVSYPNLPYLGLWHAPKTEAPYICIEPWTSLPSRQDIVEEFKFKYDLIRLNESEEFINKWYITVE